MQVPVNQILDKLQDQVDSSQLKNSVIYACSGLLKKGVYEMGKTTIDIPWDAWIAFIDFEPELNWEHKCSYYALQHKGTEILQKEAQYPPFFKPTGFQFVFLWKGVRVPEWTVVK